MHEMKKGLSIQRPDRVLLWSGQRFMAANVLAWHRLPWVTVKPARGVRPSSGHRLSFRVRLVFPGVRVGLLMDCPLRFPNLIGLLLIEGPGPSVAAAPEAREGEQNEKPQRP